MTLGKKNFELRATKVENCKFLLKQGIDFDKTEKNTS
jgi:hypothetical protein